MEPTLTLVSNRLPVSVKKTNGKLEFFPSVGGLATGLASYTESKRNKWIGWPGLPAEELTAEDKKTITTELRKHNCYPVFLTKKQIDGFYNGYSNSILWPLFHGRKIAKEARQQQAQYWKAYQEVNAAFAKAVSGLHKSGSLIWVHDYQLLLLPMLLRAEQPDNKIGFFLHIPFPAQASFDRLPEAKELIAGMLGADLIGFHTESYVHNFLDCAAAYDAGIVTQKEIVLPKRVVRVDDFPIGIDYAKYAQAVKQQAVRRELVKLRLKYRRRKVILTVDRLDPAKGLVERVRAYQTFLRENPLQRGKVVMVMLVVPSRTEIPEYQRLKMQLEAIIKEIRNEFGTKTWKPVDYLYQSLPFERISALYRRADVAFIAPLRDGMNLVAKEYLASHAQGHGVLILSQTAGAAHELKGAVMVDPSQPSSLVSGLRRAIGMSKSAWQKRVTKMQQRLSTATIHTWAGSFMNTLSTPIVTLPARVHTLTAKRQAEIIASFQAAKRRLLLLDYDGALVPLAGRPEEAAPSKEIDKLLKRLSKLPHTEVVIISGRSQADLAKWFGHLPIGLAAEHGAFYRQTPDKAWHRASSARHAWKEKILPLLELYATRTPGAIVEEKESALVWHYRLAPPYQAQKNLVHLRLRLAPLVEKYGLRAHNGKKIVEIRSTGIDKGSAAKRWFADQPDFALITGDDYTDEDTFMAAPEHAFTIKVGRGRTAARLRAHDTDDIQHLLRACSQSLLQDETVQL